MNTVTETVNTTVTNANATAAHVAAAKAKLALVAAKQAAKDAAAVLTAEKEAAKQAKADAAASAEKRAALFKTVKADIAKLDAEHAEFVDLANIEHTGKVAALLSANGLTVDDIGEKTRKARSPNAPTPSLELPTAWVKGVSIDANGFVVAVDAESSIFTIGQQGKRTAAFYVAREAAMARQNANAE
jgi:hypothetical protein